MIRRSRVTKQEKGALDKLDVQTPGAGRQEQLWEMKRDIGKSLARGKSERKLSDAYATCVHLRDDVTRHGLTLVKDNLGVALQV